jgi:hypothetical protein
MTRSRIAAAIAALALCTGTAFLTVSLLSHPPDLRLPNVPFVERPQSGLTRDFTSPTSYINYGLTDLAYRRLTRTYRPLAAGSA